MNFFQQLAALGKVDLNIRIMQKDDKLTLSISPGNSSNITPVIITGTPAELDSEFLNSIAPQVQSISGIVTNIQEVKQQVEKLEEDSKKPKENPKEKSKVETKKTEPKKSEKTKTVEPDLFADTNDDEDSIDDANNGNNDEVISDNITEKE